MPEDDLVAIAPTGDQTAKTLAVAVAKIAEAQGIDPAEITVDHQADNDVVLAPRTLMVGSSSQPMTRFPPVNQLYSLQPVQIDFVGQDADGHTLMTLEGFGTIVNK